LIFPPSSSSLLRETHPASSGSIRGKRITGNRISLASDWVEIIDSKIPIEDTPDAPRKQTTEIGSNTEAN
jgi:hypothetical protein